MKLLNLKIESLNSGRKNDRRGFSLVELVVVLAIIAILAAVAAVGLTGYLKRSRYTENSQDAISVYQTAQSTLSQKVLNGTMNDWAYSLGSIDHEGGWFTSAELVAISADDATNRSVHKIVAYTYNPKSSSEADDKFVHDLLVPGFYDQSIFGGTITLVLDVSVTSDGSSDPIYSAIVHSVFYSKQNDFNSSWGGPWDPEYINGNADESPWNRLPDRDVEFRIRKSFVGYFDGSEASITGPVALPADQVESSYIFTLRNGETLDITWSFFNDTAHNKNFQIKLVDQDDPDNYVVLTVDEAALIYDPSDSSTLTSPKALDYLSSSDPLPNNSCLSSAASEYEEVTCLSESVSTQIPYTINKESVEGLASVTVGEGTNTSRLIVPITVSNVSGDKRNVIPAENFDGYTSYTISIDCMMNRQDYVKNPVGSAGHNMLYGIDRLFGTTPKNIAAYISGTGITESYATRAIDDPMYMTGVVKNDEFTRYTYNTVVARGAYDTSAKCVVNTLFGDVYYEGNGVVVNGTTFDLAGGTAVITSYRHLSNIRMIDDPNISVDYKIARNLDWYTPSSFVTVGNGITSAPDPVSQVKVFYSYVSTSDRNDAGYSGVRYHSPVENKQLKVVSFPAIHELYPNKTLSSLSNSAGDDPVIYSINSVQMRAASFYYIYSSNQSVYANSDKGFGLICENKGTVYNIYANDLNLVMVKVNDGSASDYSEIMPSSGANLKLDSNGATGKHPFPSQIDASHNIGVPVGGLIGKNSGVIGLSDSNVPDGINTIRLSNCIVMNSRYYNIYEADNKYKNKRAVGGIVGLNNNGSSAYGVLEVRGAFAVVGRDKVAGIMGQALSKLSCRFIVDGEAFGTTQFTLPKGTHNGNNPITCIVAAKNTIGGAIALVGADPDSNVGEVADPDVGFDASIIDSLYDPSEITRDPVTGALIFSDRSLSGRKFYHIEVNLPQNSLLLQEGSYQVESAGGAIGVMNRCGGDNLSIRVENDARIVVINANKDEVYCGGAIGDDRNTSFASVFIDITNYEHSRIGFNSDNNGPTGAGGAYGRIKRDISGVNPGYIGINVTNYGTIVARKNVEDKGTGTGGAIGSVRISVANYEFRTDINSVLMTGSKVINTGGAAGGSIGYAYGNNTLTFLGNISVVSDAFASSASKPLIKGVSNVGGSIGVMRGFGPTVPSDRATEFVVDFTRAACEITSSSASGDGYIGGAVGRIYEAWKNTPNVPFTVRLGGSTVGKSGLSYIGGAIGSISIDNYKTAFPVYVSMSNGGKIFGNDYVGGAIGYNNVQITENMTTVFADYSEVTGHDNVGGVIGYNRRSLTGDFSATVNGKLSGNNYVGGIVGKQDVNSASVVLNANFTSVINGTFEGVDYIGGAFGYTNTPCNGSISSTIDADITGNKYIGGAIGYNNNTFNGNIDTSVAGSITANEDYIGGVVGYNKWGITGNVTSVVNGEITARDYIGGALGYTDATVPAEITCTVSGSITGTNNIGGAVGFNNKILSGTIISTVNADISGAENIGGAIGRNVHTVSGAVTSTVGGSVSGSTNVGGIFGYTKTTVSGTLTGYVNGYIYGSGDSVGGAIGKNEGTISGSINNSVASYIEGQNNVGGVIGYNNGTVSQALSVTLDSSAAYIKGNNSVGGVIGYNNSSVNNTITAALSGGSYIDANDNVGGAIGYSNSAIGYSVNVSISGSSYIKGNSAIGGVIGYNNKNVNASLASSMSGSSCVDGATNVGGIIGENRSAVNVALAISLTGSTHIGSETTLGSKVGGVIGYNASAVSSGISSSIGGQAYVAGSSDVGGAVGLNDGNISVDVTITNNNAVRGMSCTGGAIGRVGNTATPTISNVSVTVNRAGKPVKQISGVEFAYIGGVIGQINQGTVSNINLSGSGATVNLANIMPSDLAAAYPNKNYYSSMAVYGSGNYIGGLIGSVESSGKVINMSVDSIGLCVAATNNSSYGLGGWIGRCNGQLGNGSSNKATYEVDTVKVVYSKVGNAGGFCGEVGTGNITKKSYIYANVNMTLNGANVNGRMQIGGVYGVLDKAVIFGDMIVDLTNGTRIGDYYGTYTNGTISNNDVCICVDAGGAVGLATDNSQFEAGKIAVEFTGNSAVFAGEINDTPYRNAGVGGAFGCIGSESDSNSAKQSLPRIGINYDDNRGYSTKASDMGNSGRYISVICDSSSPCIISNLSHAGGVVGHMFSGRIYYAYSTAVIYNQGGTATGGVVGHMDKGFITHCYCGGHTVGGQYVTGSDNIVGYDCVGGFAGYIGSESFIDFCYSTASVRGNSKVGGFIGDCHASSGFLSGYGMINTCYCTGRVTANTSDSVGIFAGFVNDLDCLQNTPTLNTAGINNYALSYYNGNSSLRRIGMFMIRGVLTSYTSTSNLQIYQGVVEWGTASNINRGSYTAVPFDSYLVGSGNSTSFPYRAFIGSTHYGDWPLLQSGVTLTSSNTSISLTNTSYVYNGTEVTIPEDEMTVTYNRRVLTRDADYSVTYVNNTGAGTATVSITGINGYIGSVSKSFTIEVADLNDAEITFADDLAATEFEYTGSDVEPQVVSVTFNGVELVAGSDYDISYDNNINPTSDAVVTVTGINNYQGSLSWNFRIVRPLTDDIVTVEMPEGPFTLDDNGQPTAIEGIVVKVDGNELVLDVDYTLEFKLGENEGEGIVVITGIGNYSGTVNHTYTIVIAPPPENPTDVQDPEGDDGDGDNNGEDQNTDPENNDQSGEQPGGTDDPNTDPESGSQTPEAPEEGT